MSAHITTHAEQRASQRYGVQLTDEVAARWMGQIARRQARFVVGLDATRAVWDVEQEGRPVRLVVGRRDGKIITVLPIDKRRPF